MNASLSSSSSPFQPGETSLQLRKALQGDRDSLEWVILRLSPILVMEARERLGPYLAKLYDPEDLVQDAWLTTCSRLKDLQEQEGRYVPVALRFLSQCIIFRVNNLLRKHLGKLGDTRASIDSAEHLQVSEETTDVISKMTRSHAYQQAVKALQGLTDEERKLVLYRGVEQLSTNEVGMLLQLKANTVVVKYRRVIEKLRRRVPQSVFDDMSEI
jgi:RNA polymerase sigma factor (sigma-70 family)